MSRTLTREQIRATSDLWNADGTINPAYVPDFADCVRAYTIFYHADFLGGIRGMSAAEIGVYTVLLMEMYDGGIPIAIGDARCARLCGLPLNKYRPIKAQLIADGKLVDLDAGLWNERVEETWLRRKNERLTNQKGGFEKAKKVRKNKGASVRSQGERSALTVPRARASLTYSRTHEESGSSGEDSPTTPREPDPPPPATNIVPLSADFRVRILAAMGVGPDGIVGPNGRMIGTSAHMAMARQWVENLGLTEDEVVEVAAEKRKPSFEYLHNGPMQDRAAIKANPPSPSKGPSNGRPTESAAERAKRVADIVRNRS